MLPFLPPLLTALIVHAFCAPAAAKGILVRFLASPDADSVARYDVYRAPKAGEPGVLIGSLAAGFPAAPSGSDTLALPDSSARKGIAYAYAVRAVDRSGVESDLSDHTEVGIPLLALPDTLRPSGGITGFTLAPEAHPLRGSAPLKVSLADSSRLRILHDAAAGRIEFRSVSGRADTVAAAVEGSYFGKFRDMDRVVIIVAATSASVPSAVIPAEAIGLAPLASGGWLLRGVPSRARVDLFSASGRGLAGFPAPAAQLRLGREACGGAGAVPCLALVRDRAGKVLGRFRLIPAR